MKNAQDGEKNATVKQAIANLRDLLSLRTENTKRENANRSAKAGEDRARNNVLTAMLGRKPTTAEQSLAARY
jgi:hypothetical protein